MTCRLRSTRSPWARGLELRSPVDGIVNDFVTTIGGFVQAGQKVMEVVPMGDKQAGGNPTAERYRLHQGGRQSVVKVTVYDFRDYGGLEGRVKPGFSGSIYDEAQRSLFQRNRRNHKSFLYRPGVGCRSPRA